MRIELTLDTFLTVDIQLHSAIFSFNSSFNELNFFTKDKCDIKRLKELHNYSNEFFHNWDIYNEEGVEKLSFSFNKNLNYSIK